MKVDVSRAPALVRAAREDAGMTQRAMTDAVGLRQSNIAAIESGARPLSAEMLERLLKAADYRPTLSLIEHAGELKKLATRYGMANVRVFGSIARGDDHHDSDVDLLVDLAPTTVPFGFGAFVSHAQDLLGFNVDVLIDRPGRPGIEHIQATAVPV